MRKSVAYVAVAAVLVLARAGAGATGMRVHQATDFTGKVVTNISTVYAVTGVVAVVPEASGSEPVPYWQMTNYVTGTGEQYLLRSGANAMLGALNAGGWALTNVAPPTAADHAATKGYVDTLLTNRVLSLVSGECDTNIVEIMFSTNYYVTAVSVYQPVAVNRSVFVYIDGALIDNFTFTSVENTHTFGTPLMISRYDRLGITVTETNSTVQFCFEGMPR